MIKSTNDFDFPKDLTNIDKYKKCRYKQYDCYVCMPELGSIVINWTTVEYTGYNDELEKKHIFSPRELQEIASNPNKVELRNRLDMMNKQGLIDKVSQQTPFVIAGALGEFYTISAQDLAMNFMFVKNDEPYAINQQSLNSLLTNTASGNFLDWTYMRRKPSIKNYWALPISFKCADRTNNLVMNLKGNKHRPLFTFGNVYKYDYMFIIADDLNGRPNFSSIELCDSRVFTATFDNRGWENYVQYNTNLRFNIFERRDFPEIIPWKGDKGTIEYLKSLGVEELKAEVNNPSSPYYCHTDFALSLNYGHARSSEIQKVKCIKYEKNKLAFIENGYLMGFVPVSYNQFTVFNDTSFNFYKDSFDFVDGYKFNDELFKKSISFILHVKPKDLLDVSHTYTYARHDLCQLYSCRVNKFKNADICCLMCIRAYNNEIEYLSFTDLDEVGGAETLIGNCYHNIKFEDNKELGDYFKDFRHLNHDALIAVMNKQHSFSTILGNTATSAILVSLNIVDYINGHMPDTPQEWRRRSPSIMIRLAQAVDDARHGGEGYERKITERKVDI